MGRNSMLIYSKHTASYRSIKVTSGKWTRLTLSFTNEPNPDETCLDPDETPNCHRFSYGVHQCLSRSMSVSFYNVLRYFRTLHVFWSLVRRPVTRCLTRLQTMYNVLNIAKQRQKYNLPEPQRNRTGTGNFDNLIMTSTVCMSRSRPTRIC